MRATGGLLVGLLVGLAAVGWSRAGGEIYGTIETTRGEILTGPIRWDKNENFWDDVLDAGKTEAVERPTETEGFRFNLFGWEIISNRGASRSIGKLSIPFGHLRWIEPDGPRRATLGLKSGEQIPVRALSTDIGSGMRALVIDDAERGRVELAWQRIAKVEFAAHAGPGRDAERLYGTAKTEAGAFTGFLTWDRDESLAEDLLDGETREEEHAIPFGDIAAIEPQGLSKARVRLRSGGELVLGGTNDVNSNMRGLLVQVEGIGTVGIAWRVLLEVEFGEPPRSPAYDRFDGGRRLLGTVRTREGETYRGTITWDMDERYSWETLDGEIDDIEYSVAFDRIRSIRPDGVRRSRVELADGKVLLLCGSNDVDEHNRGILITAADGSETVLDYAQVLEVGFER